MALPPTIRNFVAKIGHSDTMALVRELGGRDFRFPAGRSGANYEYLVEIVGVRSANILVAECNGDEIYIALCDNALRADRNRRMIARYDALLKDGHSSRGAVGILVQEFRPISNRTVEKIVNGPVPTMAPEMVAQGQLF